MKETENKSASRLDNLENKLRDVTLAVVLGWKGDGLTEKQRSAHQALSNRLEKDSEWFFNDPEIRRLEQS